MTDIAEGRRLLNADELAALRGHVAGRRSTGRADRAIYSVHIDTLDALLDAAEERDRLLAERDVVKTDAMAEHDMLVADNDRLAARVAELEALISDRCAVANVANLDELALGALTGFRLEVTREARDAALIRAGLERAAEAAQRHVEQNYGFLYATRPPFAEHLADAIRALAADPSEVERIAASASAGERP